MMLCKFTKNKKFFILILAATILTAAVSAAAQVCDPKLMKRAVNGDVNAQSYVARLYVSGDGVEQDYKKARYWYRRVAGNKSADAKIIAHANLILGLLYNTGKGGDRNYGNALDCLKTAAEFGYYDAHISIGNMYAQGLGVKRDYRTALFWWKKAMENGHPKAAGLVNLLEKELSAKRSG